MVTSTIRSQSTSTKHISVALATMAIFFAWGPIAPARGQCNPHELTKVIASDAAADDFFGSSVAVSGDTAVVGANGEDDAGSNSGSAYVFVRSGTVWTQQAKLTASDAAAFDNFGRSVAVSGDTAVVGAYLDDHAGGTDAGSAYVFIRIGAVWMQQAKLIASDAAAVDNFGFSVAVSGDTAVVGAILDDHTSLMDVGSAYVFVRAGTVWTQQAKLTFASGGVMASDQFGWSVAVSGDTALVGANRFDDIFGGVNTGAAFVFVRSGIVWTQQAKLSTEPFFAPAGEFGSSVAISGDTAVVGAAATNLPSGNGSGAAYAFTRTGNAWTQQQRLIASDAAFGDAFGNSVTAADDIAVVGANSNDDAGTSSGSAYVFTRSGALWTEKAKLTASDAASDDFFGGSVALSGSTAVVGARRDDHAGGTNAGSAYVFVLDADTDADGVPDLCDDLCTGTPAGEMINADGCSCSQLNCEDPDPCTVDSCNEGLCSHVFQDSDGDGVCDGNDACPNNLPGLPVDFTGRPLRDCNGDCLVDGADIQCIVAELLAG